FVTPTPAASNLSSNEAAVYLLSRSRSTTSTGRSCVLAWSRNALACSFIHAASGLNVHGESQTLRLYIWTKDEALAARTLRGDDVLGEEVALPQALGRGP